MQKNIVTRAEEKLGVSYKTEYSLTNLILIFFIFSVFGWCWEVMFGFFTEGEFIKRGVLHGALLPIYGVAGITELLILKRIQDNLAVTFCAIMCVAGTVEYFTGMLLEQTTGQRWWDYSNYPFNVHGRICAAGLFAFGIGGCLFIYIIAPIVNRALFRIPHRVRRVICVILLFLFIVDLAYSISNPNAGIGITYPVS